MKILISGGTGFLGSKVAQSLFEKGHNITILLRESSIIDYQNTKDFSYLYYSEFINDKTLNGFDVIFYCATKYSYEKGKLIELLDANLILPLELLKIGIKAKTPYFINIDTIVDEKLNAYSMSKSNLRYWINKFEDSISIINIRIDHFYGPGDKNYKFINKIIIDLLENKKSIELTKGDQERSFIYIDDVVNGINVIIENLNSKIFFKEYNICGLDSYSIKYIVEKIKYLTKNDNTNLLWGKLPYRKNEIFKTKCNLLNIRALGWNQETDLESGLIKTIDFYKK